MPCRIASAPTTPVRTPQPGPMMKAARRPQAREIAPVGSVPAASPTTYIEIGTVASETSGARVAPTIEPVAKITAEFAPVSACAAASRSTLDRARASSAIFPPAVTSIIGTSAAAPQGLVDSAPLWRAAGCRSTDVSGRRLCVRASRHASKHQDHVVGGHLDGVLQDETGMRSKLFEIDGIAHAPFVASLTASGVEHCVAEP